MPFRPASIVNTGAGLGRFILDLIFPPRCIVCSHLGTWLCAECASDLPYIVGPVCHRCGIPLQQGCLCTRCQRDPLNLERIHSVFLFQGPLRAAVHRLKYRNGRAVARPLGQLMAEWWQEQRIPVDVIVPVPLHPRRLRERGYNQAALLAQVLGRQIDRPVRDQALERVRHTRSQMQLDAAARRSNVAGAFQCLEDGLGGRRVLLIDDVCTTGATLDACAEALQEAGATWVHALTLARAP